MLLAEITIILHTNLCIMNTVFSFFHFVYFLTYNFIVKYLTIND